MIVLYAIWAIVAWSVALVIQVAMVVICVPLMAFIPFERIQGGIPAAIFGRIPYLTLSRMTVTWDPSFDPKRVSVFCANHTSMLDGFLAVRALPHPFCGVENAEHLQLPGYGWCMRMANAIPIHKNVPDRTARLTLAAKERASRGIGIIAFPEGHRTVDGTMRPFRTGAFFMARDAGLPIVPVSFRGSFQVLPKGTIIPRPGHHLDLYVGPQLETAGLSDDEVRALAARAREIVAGWLEQRVMAGGVDPAKGVEQGSFQQA